LIPKVEGGFNMAKKIVIDLDNTISYSLEDYESAEPNNDVISKLLEYRSAGFTIVIHTSRNMRTYEGNLGLINVHTLPKIINWLNKHAVPYDEVIIGKPWCGDQGFYVDDRAIRPKEFLDLSYQDILKLL